MQQKVWVVPNERKVIEFVCGYLLTSQLIIIEVVISLNDFSFPVIETNIIYVILSLVNHDVISACLINKRQISNYDAIELHNM